MLSLRIAAAKRSKHDESVGIDSAVQSCLNLKKRLQN